MSTTPVCGTCSVPLSKKSSRKTYERFNLMKITTPRSAKIIFDGLRSTNVFVCAVCAKRVRAVGKKSQTSGRYRLDAGRAVTFKRPPGTPLTGEDAAKRADDRETPLRPLPDSDVTPTSGATRERVRTRLSFGSCTTGDKSEGWKVRSFSLLEQSKYLQLFRLLLQHSKAAKRALEIVFSGAIQRELSSIKQGEKTINSLQLRTGLTLANLGDFSWETVVLEMQLKCPMTTAAFNAAMPREQHMRRQGRSGGKQNKRNLSLAEAKIARNGRLGLQMAISLFSLNPQRYKMWQCAFGVEMWKHSTTETVFHQLNRLGVSQSKDAARSHVDRISSKSDAKIITWKKELQDRMAPNGGLVEVGVADQEPPPALPTFSIVQDNVQWHSLAHRRSAQEGNQFFLRALAFVARNRTLSTHLTGEETALAVDLGVTPFLPRPQDWEVLRQREVVIVKRIVTQHLECCKAIPVDRHVRHAFTEQMNARSSIVSLGTINANPSTHEGTLEIMKQVHSYVPTQNGEVYPILVQGDGLSVDRMRTAKEKRCRAPTPTGRLEGLIVSPQEFHHEALKLQDTVDRFCVQNSQNTPGSLLNIRDVLGHTSMKTKVLDNFSHVWNLLELTTHGHVMLLVLCLCDIAHAGEKPVDFPDDSSAREAWLHNLATRVVETVFCRVPQEDLGMTREGFQSLRREDPTRIYPFCTCHRDIGGAMVQCCSDACETSWFHIACLDPPLEAVPSSSVDWYCSDTCRTSTHYVYCVCRRHQQEEDNNMICCQRGDDCLRHGRYHPSCMGLPADYDDSNWFCSRDCAEDVDIERDAQLRHSRRLLQDCLEHMSYRDIVREGDGESLVSLWRINLLEFWGNGHTHYKRIAHNFLGAVAGVFNERLRHELVWERLANLSGREGANIGLDLCNEFLNNQFKAMMRNCRGRYSEKEIVRRSKMCGDFGNQIEELMEAVLCGEDADDNSKRRYHHRDHSKKLKTEVAQFLREYHEDNLFSYDAERGEVQLPNVPCDRRLKNPYDFGRYLRQQSKTMDKWIGLAKETARRCQNNPN